jgi:spore coat polysaccharide biosynthesis protein SpsF
MKMTKPTIAVIQARMGSTRLRGKVAKHIEGMPMLWHVVNRLEHCLLLDKIVVATSDSEPDNAIEEFCDKYKIECFRGSENDVLDRYYRAAKAYGAGTVVRITADCPLIDPKVVDKTVSAYLSDSKKYDGASNIIKRTYPRGLDTEVVSFECLEKCCQRADKKHHREHVTTYIYENPSEFWLCSVEQDADLSSMRWTVDEEADLRLISEIYKRLYKKDGIFFMGDVLEVMNKEPELAAINKGIKQTIV